MPGLVDKFAKLWQLTDLKVLSNLSHNYVLQGLQHKKTVVLKLSLDSLGLSKEAAALQAFAGLGAVAVLEQSDGILLLESAVPGNSLKDYWPQKEPEAIAIVCEIIKKLHQASMPQKEQFPHISDWLSALDKNWDIPNFYLEKSREQKNYLLKTSPNSKLLHGDLHHDNILQHVDDWLIIDPKGVFGEPCYEVAAFIRNPLPELLESKQVMKVIVNRIGSFASILELDEKRINQWCFVQSVLAWIWNIEDGLDTSYFSQLTEFFDQLTPY